MCRSLVPNLCPSLRSHGLKPARLLRPWGFPGKNTGVGCHFLLQGIFLTQESNLYLLHWLVYPLPLSHQGSPLTGSIMKQKHLTLMNFNLSIFPWRIMLLASTLGNLLPKISPNFFPKIFIILHYIFNSSPEDKMVGWHHWLNGRKFEQAPRDGEGQGSLACCSPWGCKESNTTEWVNYNCSPRWVTVCISCKTQAEACFWMCGCPVAPMPFAKKVTFLPLNCSGASGKN